MTTNLEKTESLTLPVIALRGSVCFPSVQLNLEIMRGFSLKAFSKAASEDGKVLLLAQKDIEVTSPREKDFYRTGTIAQIHHVAKATDGNLSVVFEGLSRAKVESIDARDGYLEATVVAKSLRASNVIGDRVDALMMHAHHLLKELPTIHPHFTEEMRISACAMVDCGIFADFVASAALVDYHAKQSILEILHPVTRLEKLIYLLEDEMEIMRCEHDISRKVRSHIDENQREYYLREQIKVIQQELGEDSDELEEYAFRIDSTPLPADVAKKLKKELARLSKTPFGAAESTVLRNYLDTCLDLPWGQYSTGECTIQQAKAILDADHEGLDKVKDRILEYLAVESLSHSVKNQILCLIGPPGTGKTSIASSLAKAMRRKYVRISLGGVRDEADIRGHRKTYVGAMPGRIINALIDAKTMNPLILLDEIDKLTSDAHGDPASALLEVLDPEQNKYFQDHFVEFPLDLSDCVFVATANSYDTIPEPLLDRMEVIDIRSYSENEKVAIAKNHLLPKQIKRHGLTKRQFKITDEALREVIRKYTREAGVRNLERELATLIRKVARKIAEGERKSVTIKSDMLSAYLGKPKSYDNKPETENMIGIVNGLAYTQSGGDLLPVEVKLMNGQGKLELTGSLGEVMRESASIALSYVRSIADQYGIPDEAFKNKDIHIHFPEGATPKDGPSAGAAMTVALLSAFAKKPVRCDIAMTGEMTLRGRILAIGGLREKTFAAFRSGIKHVILPIDNKPDLDEIDEVVRANVCFHFVSMFDDIPSLVFSEEEGAQIEDGLNTPPFSLADSAKPVNLHA
ncbi:MAG: endopeptidase La [Clostridia bacterium]|nr:endopeptidase La [Clostridia bacterium]